MAALVDMISVPVDHARAPSFPALVGEARGLLGRLEPLTVQVKEGHAPAVASLLANVPEVLRRADNACVGVRGSGGERDAGGGRRRRRRRVALREHLHLVVVVPRRPRRRRIRRINNSSLVRTCHRPRVCEADRRVHCATLMQRVQNARGITTASAAVHYRCILGAPASLGQDDLLKR